MFSSNIIKSELDEISLKTVKSEFNNNVNALVAEVKLVLVIELKGIC